MKKILLLPACLIGAAITLKAQIKDLPPPPPPPPPLLSKVVKTKLTEPVITVRGKMADEFYKRNPSKAGISRMGNVITLQMKDKTTKKYDMTRKEDKKSFTDKYGNSPIPPPPPKKTKLVTLFNKKPFGQSKGF
jgi:hypothetical protein